MPVKTTGAEFKRFYNAPEFWPDADGDVWHEDVVIRIDGVEHVDGIDVETLRDDARIEIEGGIVFGPMFKGNEPSLETYFKRWRKKQTTVVLLVECDAPKLNAVKAAIKAAGGRVGN